MADDYDDPAYSGGNMERPGLKRSLADIERGLIDIVVVYKIDRLTRSLVDFSKMVVDCGSEYRKTLATVAGFCVPKYLQCRDAESSGIQRPAAKLL